MRVCTGNFHPVANRSVSQSCVPRYHTHLCFRRSSLTILSTGSETGQDEMGADEENVAESASSLEVLLHLGGKEIADQAPYTKNHRPGKTFSLEVRTIDRMLAQQTDLTNLTNIK